MADEGLQSAPGGASVIMALADLYFQNGMLDQAIDLATSAIEKNPEAIEAYIILAKVYKQKGDMEKMQEFAEKGLKIAPDNPDLKEYISAPKEIPSEQKIPTIKEEKTPEQEISEEIPSEQEVVTVEEKKTPSEEIPTEQKIQEAVKKEEVVSVEKTGEIEEKVEQTPVSTVIEEESPPPQKIVVKGEKEPTIQDILSEITHIKGIFGALVIDETGLPIAQKVNVPLDIESTSALISVINKEARESIGRMGIGNFTDGIIEMEKGKIFIFDIDPVILSILTNKEVMMGLIMVKVRKAIKVIRKVLEI